MEEPLFEIRRSTSQNPIPIPHVDENQMKEVDRIAMEDFHIGILQMMENAGRNLALLACQFLEHIQFTGRSRKVLVAAGSGGNGGGGLCAARHLHNQGIAVNVVLTKPSDQYIGAARDQLTILESAGIIPMDMDEARQAIAVSDLVLDAIIGYSLGGAPRKTAEQLIRLINQSGKPVISLDLPSGLNATNGTTPGTCIKADQTLSLALPKPGLKNPVCGDLFIADIGIPPEVYLPLGIKFDPFFGGQYILPIDVIGTKLS